MTGLGYPRAGPRTGLRAKPALCHAFAVNEMRKPDVLAVRSSGLPLHPSSDVKRFWNTCILLRGLKVNDNNSPV